MEFLKSKKQLLADNFGSVNEGATKHGDVWKVHTVIDIPKSLINAFVSKAKKENGIDPREEWSDRDLSELFVSYITANFINIESLPVKELLGDQSKTTGEVQTDVQPSDVQVQPETVQPVQQVQTSEPVQPAQGEPTAEIQN